MTAQLSDYAMSGPMASDENGGGNSNDSGSDDSAATVVAAAAVAAERVVMIAFKMEVTDDEETGDAAAGPSAERQADVILEGMVQTTPPFPNGTEGKTCLTYSIFFLLDIVLSRCSGVHIFYPNSYCVI